jgi:exodeoxyribonuclease III
MMFVSRYYLPFLLLIALKNVANTCSAQSTDTTPSLRIMSFNLWHGGDAGKQPLSQTLAVITSARADCIGIQEVEGNAPNGTPRPDNAAKLAKELNWHYFAQGGRKGIISRFPIASHTPRKHGVKIMLPSGKPIYLFNVHLNHSPYQPYQLLNIPYGDGKFIKTEAEAIEEARKARGTEIEEVLQEIKAVEAEGHPIFLTGDFNEPSCLDWTAEAARAKLCPIEVRWPTTQSLIDAGMIDAYRQISPDPTIKRGLTWTPLTKPGDPRDRHDRIDMIWFKGMSTKVKSVEIVGESNEYADIVVTPYPSDHRAIIAEIETP